VVDFSAVLGSRCITSVGDFENSKFCRRMPE
jgi:hypothetical protein